MFDEIRSTSNFLCQFLFEKIPRRRVSLFAEDLSNSMLTRLIHQPHMMLKVSLLQNINVDGFPTDSIVIDAAKTTGLDAEEVLHHLPANLTIWAYPQEVTYQCGAANPVQPLFNGKDGSGLLNNNTEKLDKALATLTMTLTDDLTLPISGIGVGVGDCNLQLSDRPNYRPATKSAASLHGFELCTPNDQKFTTAAFAATRFGSTKKKLDLCELRRIQLEAGVSSSSDSGCSTITTPSPNKPLV